MTATLSYRIHINGYPYLAVYDPAAKNVKLWAENLSAPGPLSLLIPLASLEELLAFVQSRKEAYHDRPEIP